MFKKAIIAGAGLLLIGAIVFGGKLIPYAQTAYDNVVDAVNDKVSVDFQIQAARTQLEKIGPEIHKMVQTAAKEKADIKRLKRELAGQNDVLQRQYEDMMALRSHLESGDNVYVAIDNHAYSNNQVESDLRNRFENYKKAEATRDTNEKILVLRQQALETALSKLDDAKAQKRSLEVQIENLQARKRMVDIASASSEIDMDNSQLARTQSMIDDITARLDAKEEMLNFIDEPTGGIPVSSETVTSGDILEDMDRHFTTQADDNDVVLK